MAKLPSNIAEAIKKHVSKIDQIQSATTNGLSYHDIRHLLHLEIGVHKKHIPALQELKSRAIKNANESYNDIQLLENFEI